MTERVFVQKMGKVGFEEVQVGERLAFGLERATKYPPFTEDLIDLMRDLIPAQRQSEIATSVVVTAIKP